MPYYSEMDFTAFLRALQKYVGIKRRGIILSKRQIKDSDECEKMQENGEDMNCSDCSCSVCIAQVNAKMFDNKELATIMGALINITISRKDEISGEEYICEEERDSLLRQVKVLERLSNKISILLKD